MSDPVTNVEIEDVLSSIRRLVSDGDKARSRDTVQIEPSQVLVAEQSAAQSTAPESTPDWSQPDPKPASLSDRLVLTPAFLVVDEEDQTHDETPEPAIQDNHAQDRTTEDSDRQDNSPEYHTDTAEDASSDSPLDDGPLELTEMVWDEAEEPSHDAETPARPDLVATIAELEAAISAGGDDYEPDGSETMSETIPWPGAIARGTDDVEDAEVAPDVAPEAEAEAEADADALSDDPEVEVDEPDADEVPRDGEADVYVDDDLDGLPEVGGVSLDEEALRELVADVVRQELSGDLGEKITRNVRKLVRREIYRILSSQEFD